MYYVYVIKNIEYKKYYIGIAKDVGKRFREHISFGLRGYEKIKNTHPCKKGLYIDIYKLGIDKFAFKVLEIVNTHNKTEVYNTEEKWIRKFNSVEQGYNTVYNAGEYKNMDRTTFRVNDYRNKCGTENLEIFKNIKNEINKGKKKDSRLYRYQYVYSLIHGEDIIYIGNRRGEDASSVKGLIYDYFSTVPEDSTSLTARYILENGGFDNFSIHIIKEIHMDEVSKELIEEIKETYKETNRDRLNLKQIYMSNNI